MKRLVFGLFLLLTIQSCVGCWKSRSVMDVAESLMSDAPDSSLTLLNGINRESLLLRGMRERHTLLLTMAHDKCYMPMSSDTIIRSASNWYQHHGSKRYRMLSAYYLGVVQQSRGENIEAVLAFREAEPLAESLSDYRQLSLIEQHLCALFASNFDHVHALEYAEKSLSAAMKSGESLMADFCKLDIAEQLLVEFRYEEAERIVDELLCSENSDIFFSLTLGLKSRILIFKDSDYESAKQIYKNAPSEKLNLSAGDYGRLALFEEIDGNSSLADTLILEASNLLKSKMDSLVFYNDCFNLYSQRKDLKSAIDYLSKRADLQDNIVMGLLRQSEAHALERYYRDTLVVERLRIRHHREMMGIAGVLLIVIIISLALQLKRNNRRLLEDMAKIQEVSEDLRVLESKNARTYQVVDGLIADKVHLLQQLSESFFSWEDDALKKQEKKNGTLMKDEIIDSFRRQLGELRADKSFIYTLEQSLNITEDGVMTKLRQILKNEKELDYSILTLLFSGFSIKSISYLFRMSEASLRMRKTRYRQQFLSLQEPERSVFLGKIG